MKRISKTGKKFELQHCIESTEAKVIIQQTPSELKITHMKWYGTNKRPYRHMEVSNKLRAGGVRCVREKSNILIAEGTFKNQTKEQMLGTLYKVSEVYDVPSSGIQAHEVVFTDGNGNTSTWKKDKKEIHQDADKRKKLSVLGLIKETESHNNKIKEMLHASLYRCNFQTELVKTRICSRKVN